MWNVGWPPSRLRCRRNPLGSAALRCNPGALRWSIPENKKISGPCHRMPERKTPAAARMSRIRGGGGEPFYERCRHSGVADRSCPAAVAHCQELAVPSRGGKPRFHFDIGVRRGPYCCGHAAERRKIAIARNVSGTFFASSARSGQSQPSSRDDFRHIDRCIRKRQFGQTFARCRVHRRSIQGGAGERTRDHQNDSANRPLKSACKDRLKNVHSVLLLGRWVS